MRIRFHLRNQIALLTLIMLSAFAPVSASATVITKPANLKPRAALEKVWIDYDQTENGRKGMRMHAAFTLYELKEVDCQLRFTVADAEKKYLVTFDDMGEDVDIYREVTLKPGYEPAYFKDLSTFIAYGDFELDDGKWELNLDVDIYYPNGDLIEHLTWYPFEYSQGDPTKRSTKVTVDLTSKSVDYDVTRNGVRGMLLHVYLDNLTGLKGIDSAVRVKILDTKYNAILGDTAAYSDADGNFVARYDIKPSYDPAKFDNIQIFIPYSQISIGKGSHRLQLDIDLIYADGLFISHLGYHEFDFTR